MSGPLVSASAAFVAKNSRIPPYAIEQSLFWNGLGYSSALSLRRTQGTATSNKICTFSTWQKKSNSNGNTLIFWGTASNQSGALGFSGTQKAGVGTNLGLSGYNESVALQRDDTAWYHYVYQIDTTQATNTNRFKCWVNGVQITDWSPTFYPAQDSTWLFGSAVEVNMCAAYNSSAQFSSQGEHYIAETYFIDGTAYEATDFGGYDDNGVWRPIEVTGLSYGNNGFYLSYDSSAANGVGHDHSGNGNHFTLTDTGNNTAVVSDTPTTNWCTFNPLNSNGGTLSNGNLDASGTSNFFQSTIMVNSGKYYFEFTKNANGDNQFGIAYGGDVAATDAFRRAWRDNNGTPQWLTDNATAGSGTPESCAVNDVVGVALDMDNNAVYFSKNGTYMNSGDPTSGSSKTGAIWTDLAGQSWGPMASSNANGLNCTLNCGQRAFAYTPPTGFKALNTKNLPAPTIKDGSKYFNTVLYTATQTAQSITGVGFQPDLVWAKRRSGSVASHNLFDVLRGVRTHLESNTTNAETTEAAGASLTSFDTDGFSVGTPNLGAGSVNSNTNDTFVAWNWIAGGSGSSNTDGSITSTVSANPTAGFSIVSYTGNVTAGATVGHGLGVAPEMIIVKNRDTSGYQWVVYHKDVGATKYLYLSATNAAATYTNYWNNTAPSSTVFTIGTDNAVNASGQDMIAYCFAEVEGYSKFGSWVGNLNADGPFIYTGFLPAFIMWKRNGVDGWVMKDSVRNTYNTVSTVLYANLSNAESSTQEVDFLSNGFKIRTNSGASNSLGDTYIYMAFAENPFGGSGVNPATAR